MSEPKKRDGWFLHATVTLQAVAVYPPQTGGERVLLDQTQQYMNRLAQRLELAIQDLSGIDSPEAVTQMEQFIFGVEKAIQRRQSAETETP